MHELIKTLISDGPVVTDGAWGTQMQARGLRQRRLSGRMEPLSPGRRRGGSARVRPGGQPGRAHQHVPCQSASPWNRLGWRIGRSRLNRSGSHRSPRRAAGDQATLSSARSGPAARCSAWARVAPELNCGRRSVEQAAGAGTREERTAIVIETMGDLEEAVLAVEAAKSRPTCQSSPVCVSIPGKDLDRTMMGVTPGTSRGTALSDRGSGRPRRELRTGG